MENSKQIQIGLLALVAILLGLNLTGALDGLMGKSSDETSVRDAARANVTSNSTAPAPAASTPSAPAIEVPTGPTTTIEFTEKEFDFGTIDQGTNVEHVFEFTNTGEAPLVIVNAKSSCGCTVPTYPKTPVEPGATAEMLVKFNGSGKNQVSKTVTITANTETGKETIKIKAFVNPKGNSGPTTK